MTDRTVLRLGSWAAILGGVLAVVANLLHPRFTDADTPAETMQIVAASENWTPVHVAILISFLLITFGFFAFARSMKAGPAEGWSRVALGALVLSAPVALVTALVDGYVMKEVAGAVAAGGAAAASAGIATAHLSWALFMGLNILFLGITPIAYGVAAANDGGYPAWMGWVAVVVGGVSALNGTFGLLAGASATFYLIFTAASAILTLWVIAAGILLGRRAAAPAPVPAAAPA